MSKVFFGSIGIKGFGAVLEVLLQIIILRFLNVDGYGSYGYYIGIAEIGYWIFFSGITKCNLFYGSQCKKDLSGFRKNYYIKYVCPVLILCAGVSVYKKSFLLLLTTALLGMETLVFEKSSRLLAAGKYSLSLIGEYCLGRCFITAGAFVLGMWNCLTLESLVFLYLCQYAVIFVVFTVRGRLPKGTEKADVSVKKLAAYQYGDVLVGIIHKAPVILEYLFTGAFAAGFVQLIALVRTLVAFVSGPTSKVFLPSFARLHRTGEYDKIRELFQKVIVLQMLFLIPVSVALVGFPDVILGIFSNELLEYSAVFAGISLCFVIALSFGPCSGLLQMTGNEHKDIQIRSFSVVLMVVVWILTGRHELFVLYGIGSQILVENVADYYTVSRILGKMPIGLGRFVFLWLPSILTIFYVRTVCVPQTMLNMMLAVSASMLLYGTIQLMSRQVRHWIKEEMKENVIKE